jgi:hypothetical protein
MRPSLDRLGIAYHGTSWVLGREAASLLPLDSLAGGTLRVPWSWQTTALAAALEAIEPSMARDGRVVQIVDAGPEAIVAAVLGGATAGYRLVSARTSDADDDAAAVVELIPPGARLPPGARTRANVGLDPVPGGAGDPDIVPSTRLFGAPERFDDRPFSATDTARTVTEVAVDTLRERGEPARFERLLGEILVGLDRAGQLRRLAIAARAEGSSEGPAPDGSPRSDRAAADADAAPADRPRARGRRGADTDTPADPVDRLVGIIRDELGRPTQRRLVEIEPGRWWLADRTDLADAAVPLADRVEWAVFSLLSTAGQLSEAAFYERIASLFGGHEMPDHALVQACLDSYRSLASTPDRIVTTDDLLGRSQEHTDILATIAEAGHRLGMRVWIGRREQTRRVGSGTLGDVLDEGEKNAHLGIISPAAEELAEVDVIWYVRGKVGFLFEVEWTAMLGEPVLRKHARIPPDDGLIRFLVIAPERAELVRYKLARSPLLRAALDAGTWHIIKANHLRAFLAHDPLDLSGLEPYLGLDPPVERSAEQMALFGGASDVA